MEILLINPPMYDQRNQGTSPVFPYSPPLGLAYMAPNIRALGHDVTLADMTYCSKDQVMTKLREKDWDVIGICVLTEQRQSARALCTDVRIECPDAVLVLGGVHPTLLTRQVADNWDCDAIVIGEGETTICSLIEAISRKTPLGSVAGLALRDKDGRCMRTASRPVIENLDVLPFPSYQDFDLNAYKLWTVFEDATSRRDSKESITIITSRGCTARCSFCSTYIVWRPGQKSPGGWRGRSPVHVVDEIELLHKDYGKTFFNIADDLFSVDEERVIGICQEIIRRKLDILWDCETRVTMVSPSMLKWMKRAGCHSVAYGVESLGDWVLKRINKGIDPEDVYRAFKWTQQAGIKSRAMLMIGNQGEDEDSINATCDFISRCRPDTVQASVTKIFPGTALYHWARKQGFIDDAYWLTDKPAPYNTVENSFRLMKRWEGRILERHATGFEKLLRKLRLSVETNTGVCISRKWIDIYRGDDHLWRLTLPGA